MNLFDYKELINDKPIHIATVNKNNNPNLSVASDVRVIEEDKIIISVNEMINTPENIKYNKNVVITVFDEEWVGLKIWGEAIFYAEGRFYDFCKNTFFGNGEASKFGATEPKGAIVVTVSRVDKFE